MQSLDDDDDDDDDIERGRRSGPSVPYEMSMDDYKLAAVNLTHAPHTVSSSRTVDDMFFCFFTPRGATPRSDLSAWIQWGVQLFSERFTHVECLFKMAGNAADPNNWIAITVTEKRGIYLVRRNTAWYRDARWSILRLKAQPKQRNRMYNFAVAEARKRRAYNHAVLCLAAPYLSSLCAPLIKCCRPLLCCNVGNADSVYCVQLMCEILQSTLADDYRDLRPDRMRADQLHEELRRRKPGVQPVILSIESENEPQVIADMLSFAGTDLWSGARRDFNPNA